MNSKFYVLILEDDEEQGYKLKNKFSENFSENFEIIVVKNLEEFRGKISDHYYIGMSLDHKVPENKENSQAKMYDVSVIIKLNKYQPLGYKTIYTAFPKWQYAKQFAAKEIEYFSKKDLKIEDWAEKFKNKVDIYKNTDINMETKEDIYDKAKDELIFPFVSFISDIINDPNEIENYKRLFDFSIDMFYMVFLVIFKKDDKNIRNIDKEIEFMHNNLWDNSNNENLAIKEFKKTIDKDFLKDMKDFKSKLDKKDCSINEEDCQDYMAQLMIRLNFFCANSLAVKAEARLNYLRQREVKIEKLSNKIFLTKEYITNFYNLPDNSKDNIYLIIKDYDGKCYFEDISSIFDIKTKSIDNKIEIYFKPTDTKVFPTD